MVQACFYQACTIFYVAFSLNRLFDTYRRRFPPGIQNAFNPSPYSTNMTKDDCYELGYVTKTHGLKGGVSVFLDVDFPEEYEELDSVLLDQKGTLVPFFIESIQLVPGSRAIVKFEEIDTIEQAETLVGSALYLTLDNLPELDEGQFYYHEIVGCQVIDQQQGVLGTVSDVSTGSHQDIVVMIYQNREVLFPATDEIVLSFDRRAKQLTVNLPDGLLDVYLND